MIGTMMTASMLAFPRSEVSRRVRQCPNRGDPSAMSASWRSTADLLLQGDAVGLVHHQGGDDRARGDGEGDDDAHPDQLGGDLTPIPLGTELQDAGGDPVTDRVQGHDHWWSPFLG